MTYGKDRFAGNAHVDDGLLNTTTTFNATTAQFSYDNARRLTQVTNQQTSTTPSTLISQHTYTLDAVGNRTHLDEQAPFIKVITPEPCVGGCPPFAMDPGAPIQADEDADLQTASLAATPLAQTASPPAAGASPSGPQPLALVDQSQDASLTYQFRAEPAAYHVEVFSKTSGQADVRLQHPASGTSLGFTALGSMTAHTTQGPTAISQVGSATVRWTVFPHGLKEDVELPARPQGDQIGFTVQSTGLSVEPDGHGGYRARDSHGITRFHLLAPFAWDAAGHLGSATLTLQGTSAAIQLDPTFLSRAVYPITVDPTIHFAIDYTYDHLYRLTAVSTSDLTDGTSSSASYSYDPLGNRLSKVAGTTTTSYSYDRADRITSAAGTSYMVNASGNLVARGTDRFGYDQANRLTSASVGGTTSASVYDGDGKRASKTAGTITTSYVYDVVGGLPVVLDDGTQKYIWGAGGLAYSVNKTSAAVAVYNTDGLGSVRALSDSTGTVFQAYQTDEFGVPTLTQGSSTQPFGYTGEQSDPERGLLYLRARMYDPTMGRFIQRDPLTKSGPGVLGWNRFTYVGDNPVSRRDPPGLKAAALDPGACIPILGDLVYRPSHSPRERQPRGRQRYLCRDVRSQPRTSSRNSSIMRSFLAGAQKEARTAMSTLKFHS